MSDYTPTTGWVAAGWLRARRPDGVSARDANAEFDRWLAAHDAEVERGVADRISVALGCGDGINDRAATLGESIEMIEHAVSEAGDHSECARYCGYCGKQAADQTCEHCHGSGCGPGTALGAYEECEWCAGVGKTHEDCPELVGAAHEKGEL